MPEHTDPLLKANRIAVGVASVLMIVVASFWTLWGTAEMYHEGWWGSWTHRLGYLVPIAVTVGPMLLAFRWPLVGGAVIVAVGVFALFMFSNDVAILGVFIVLLGLVFLIDGFFARKRTETESTGETPGWRRNWRMKIGIFLPLLAFIGTSVQSLPIVLTRQDDGIRSARLIEGNGLSLIWAPEGPGWNFNQDFGGYPSWQRLALYGVEPIGFDDKEGYGEVGDTYVFATEADMAATNLCLYLNEEGTELLTEPVGIWRMPTTDEIVRSLVRHGENAGCEWTGEFRKFFDCEVKPDKESPLWSTEHAPIYYWTAESESDDRGYFVSYNGMVSATRKTSGNPRHSHRCVRDSD